MSAELGYRRQMWKIIADGDILRAGLTIRSMQRANCIDTRSIGGMTPLMLACENGKLQIAVALVEAGADINAKSSYGDTSLTLAAYNGHTDVIEFLLDRGADINTQNNNGNSALILATGYNQVGVVKTLLGVSANTTIQNKSGDTALVIAKREGYAEIADVLEKAIGVTK